MLSDLQRMSLGDRIRELRRQKGWNQKQLAQKIGCQVTVLAQVEQAAHRVSPRLDTIVEIAQALGVSVCAIVRVLDRVPSKCAECDECDGSGRYLIDGDGK